MTSPSTAALASDLSELRAYLDGPERIGIPGAALHQNNDRQGEGKGYPASSIRAHECLQARGLRSVPGDQFLGTRVDQ